MTRTADIDWLRVRQEHEIGKLSNRVIGQTFGVSEAAIRKRAAKEGWERKPAARQEVDKRAAAMLAPPKPEHTALTDDEALTLAATRETEVLRSHRSSIARGRQLVDSLFGELAQECADLEVVAEAIEETEKADAKRRMLARRAISLPARAATARELSMALAKLTQIERVAFGIADPVKGAGQDAPEDGIPLEERIRSYEREDAIEASDGKVIAMQGRR